MDWGLWGGPARRIDSPESHRPDRPLKQPLGCPPQRTNPGVRVCPLVGIRLRRALSDKHLSIHPPPDTVRRVGQRAYPAVRQTALRTPTPGLISPGRWTERPPNPQTPSSVPPQYHRRGTQYRRVPHRRGAFARTDFGHRSTITGPPLSDRQLSIHPPPDTVRHVGQSAYPAVRQNRLRLKLRSHALTSSAPSPYCRRGTDPAAPTRGLRTHRSGCAWSSSRTPSPFPASVARH